MKITIEIEADTQAIASEQLEIASKLLQSAVLHNQPLKNFHLNEKDKKNTLNYIVTDFCECKIPNVLDIVSGVPNCDRCGKKYKPKNP